MSSFETLHTAILLNSKSEKLLDLVIILLKDAIKNKQNWMLLIIINTYLLISISILVYVAVESSGKRLLMLQNIGCSWDHRAAVCVNFRYIHVLISGAEIRQTKNTTCRHSPALKITSLHSFSAKFLSEIIQRLTHTF